MSKCLHYIGKLADKKSWMTAIYILLVSFLLSCMIAIGIYGKRPHVALLPTINLSTAQYEGLEATIWITGRTNESLAFEYSLRWIGDSYWLFKLSGVDITVSFLDAGGSPLDETCTRRIQFDEDFVSQRRKHFAVNVVAVVPEDAVQMRVQLGASQLITRSIAMPNRE